MNLTLWQHAIDQTRKHAAHDVCELTTWTPHIALMSDKLTYIVDVCDHYCGDVFQRFDIKGFMLTGRMVGPTNWEAPYTAHRPV